MTKNRKYYFNIVSNQTQLLLINLKPIPAPPKNTMIQINKLIFEFMWNGKPDKIKRNIMLPAKEHGEWLFRT